MQGGKEATRQIGGIYARKQGNFENAGKQKAKPPGRQGVYGKQEGSEATSEKSGGGMQGGSLRTVWYGRRSMGVLAQPPVPHGVVCPSAPPPPSPNPQPLPPNPFFLPRPICISFAPAFPSQPIPYLEPIPPRLISLEYGCLPARR